MRSDESFARTCRDLLGWNDHRTFALLSGTSAASTEPAQALAARAAAVRRPPLLCRLLPIGVDAEQVLAADPEFTAAFTDSSTSGPGARHLRLRTRPGITTALVLEIMMYAVVNHMKLSWPSTTTSSDG